MQFLSPDQSPEISGILGDDNPVFSDRIAQYHMIRITPSPDIARMNRRMTTRLNKPHRDLR